MHHDQLKGSDEANPASASPQSANVVSTGLHVVCSGQDFFLRLPMLLRNGIQATKRAVDEINSGLNCCKLSDLSLPWRSTSFTRMMQRQVSSLFAHAFISKRCHSSQRRDEASFSVGKTCPNRHGYRKIPQESSHPRIQALFALEERGLESSMAPEGCRDKIKHPFSAGEMRPSRRAWRKR